MTQANNVLNLLGGVQSGATAYQPADYSNRTGAVLSGIPKLTQGFGDLYKRFNQLPWQSSGNVNPNGGFY
jgi:hypothetical protein